MASPAWLWPSALPGHDSAGFLPALGGFVLFIQDDQAQPLIRGKDGGVVPNTT